MWRVLPSIPTDLALKLKGILNDREYIIDSKTGINLKCPYQYSIEKKHNIINPNKISNKNANDFNANVNENNVILTSNSNSNANNDEFNAKDNEVFVVNNPQSINNRLTNFKGDAIACRFLTDTPQPMIAESMATILSTGRLLSYYVPNVIQSHEAVSNESVSEFTDVVYYDFIEPFVLDALREACDGDEELFERLSVAVQYYNDCPVEYNLGQLLKNYAVNNPGIDTRFTPFPSPSFVSSFFRSVLLYFLIPTCVLF